LKTNNKNGKVRAQDIADMLDISLSTVSRALSNHPRISKETKERVKQVATRLGYYTGMPELMNPEKTDSVVILVPSIESKIYRDIVRGVTASMQDGNYQAFVYDTDFNLEKIDTFLKTYKKYGISGIIHVICKRNLPAGLHNIIIKDRLPAVTIFETDDNSGLSSVLPDMFQGASKIITYLKSLNIKSLALLLDNLQQYEDNQILSSFETAMEMSEMDKKGLSVFYELQSGMKEIGELLSSDKRPQVIMVKDILKALEIINISEKSGIKIPEDLIVIAIDSQLKDSALTSNISLLKIPSYEMGYEAGEILLYQMRHPDAERKTAVVPVNFILKGSAIRMK